MLFYLSLKQWVICGVLHLGFRRRHRWVPSQKNQLEHLKGQNFLWKAFRLKTQISASKSNMAAYGIKHETQLRNKPLFYFSMSECPESVVCIQPLLVTHFPRATRSTCSCWTFGSIRKKRLCVKSFFWMNILYIQFTGTKENFQDSLFLMQFNIHIPSTLLKKYVP